MTLFKIPADEDDWDTICYIPFVGGGVGMPITPYGADVVEPGKGDVVPPDTVTLSESE